MRRRILKIGLLIVAGLVALVLIAALTGTAVFRGSLARLDGRGAVPGLEAAVAIERDALGVPRITAGSREDAARALGWLHAQERFFQMDLLRRSAAGELAALLGPALVPTDRDIRRHRFRTRLEAGLLALD